MNLDGMGLDLVCCGVGDERDYDHRRAQLGGTDVGGDETDGDQGRAGQASNAAAAQRQGK